MGLLDDIRANRRRVKTKAELLRGLKDAPLAGDMNRSMALGESDARRRSGPEAAAGTGQRYNPDQFYVDNDGRLNIRTRDILQSLDDLPDDGGPAIGSASRFPIYYARDFLAGTDDVVSRAPMIMVPKFNNTTTDISYHYGVLPVGWPVADFTLGIIAMTDVTGAEATFSIDVTNTDPGGLYDKTPDASLSTTLTHTGRIAKEMFLHTVTIPGAALTASTKVIWLKFVYTAHSGAPSTVFLNMYAEKI